MGTSPKEQASSDMNDRLKTLQDRYLGGDLSGQMLYNQVKPTFEQGKNDLNTALSTRMAGIGKNIGESMITGGVAKGAPQANLFAGAMAPALAQNQTELSNITQREGMTLGDMIKFALSQAGDTGKQELGAISGMKDSTTMGDVMGGLTSAFSLADIITNPELLAMFSGKSGGSADVNNIASGGVNSMANEVLKRIK